MNTGGGKTVVGLLIAKSCVAEGEGPVAYLVPDQYLVDQVRAEADRLGVETTADAKVLAYPRARPSWSTRSRRVFNGESSSASAAARPTASAAARTVIIDDAHACLNKAEQAFRLRSRLSRGLRRGC